MELSEKIQKQIAAGFSASDINENLQAEGYDKAEIEKELSQHRTAEQSTGQVSTKAVLIGLLLFVIIIFRIARLSNSSGAASTFGIISIIAGILVLILYLARRR